MTDLLLLPVLGHPVWLWLLFIAIGAALLAFALPIGSDFSIRASG